MKYSNLIFMYNLVECFYIFLDMFKNVRIYIYKNVYNGVNLEVI